MMREELPVFGKIRSCPKCGHDRVNRFTFERGFNFTYIDTVDENEQEQYADVLEITCKQCGYGWNELPLDAS